MNVSGTVSLKQRLVQGFPCADVAEDTKLPLQVLKELARPGSLRLQSREDCVPPRLAVPQMQNRGTVPGDLVLLCTFLGKRPGGTGWGCGER